MPEVLEVSGILGWNTAKGPESPVIVQFCRNCLKVQQDDLVKCIWVISINVAWCTWVKGCCQLRLVLRFVLVYYMHWEAGLCCYFQGNWSTGEDWDILEELEGCNAQVQVSVVIPIRKALKLCKYWLTYHLLECWVEQHWTNHSMDRICTACCALIGNPPNVTQLGLPSIWMDVRLPVLSFTVLC